MKHANFEVPSVVFLERFDWSDQIQHKQVGYKNILTKKKLHIVQQLFPTRSKSQWLKTLHCVIQISFLFVESPTLVLYSSIQSKARSLSMGTYSFPENSELLISVASQQKANLELLRPKSGKPSSSEMNGLRSLFSCWQFDLTAERLIKSSWPMNAAKLALSSTVPASD